MSKQDYYEVLGIERKADEAEIKKAYRRMAMKHHPDRHKGDKGAEEKFKEVTQAYEVLSNPEKRRTYDQYGHAGVDQAQQRGGFHPGAGGAGGFEDLFGGIFSDIFGQTQGGQRQQTRGADLKYNLEISLEEAAEGMQTTLQIPTWVGCGGCEGSGAKKGSKPKKCTRCHGQGQIRIQQGFFALQQTCPSCHGEGQVISDPCQSCHGQGRVKDQKKLNVKIPAGVDAGDRIRLSREGEAAQHGGTPGDLYVEIHLKPHAIFQRQAENLTCEVPIGFTQAALGGELEVPTLNGRVKLHIPPETQTGKVFKITGKGVKPLRGHRQGDLLCRVVVETPVDLTAKQKELLKALEDETEAHKHTPKADKWMNRVKEFFTQMKF